MVPRAEIDIVGAVHYRPWDVLRCMIAPMSDPEGSHAELLAVLQRMRPALIAFFTRRLRDPSQAEDLTQDLFVRMATAPVTAGGNPEGYIFQAAANLLRDHYRRETTRGRYLQSQSLDEQHHVDPIDAERLLAGQQSIGCVAQVLKRLPERTRRIFILYRLEGMQRKAIAEVFGISVSAVEKHIATAMRSLLADMGGGR